MDCNYSIIKTCELKGSTFRTHTLNFGAFDISEFNFRATYSSFSGKTSMDLIRLNNTVQLPLGPVENQSGNVKVEVWMEKEGERDLAALFDVEISADNCGCTDTVSHDITITYEELVIPVTVTQAIVNNYIDYNNLTPEQKTELRFDYEDFTPENIEVLQRPAKEAAAEARLATQDTLSAKEAAETATQNAKTATQEAAQAAAGATQAAGAASSAAQSANQSAANADNAAGAATTSGQAADQAASEAREAAQTANAARGWSPVLAIDSQTIPNKSLMIIEDWTGGTGTKPTEGKDQWLKVGGGFTGDPMEAENIKGKQGEIAVLEFEVNDEMDLIQYTEGEELNFAISAEGDLTLTF